MYMITTSFTKDLYKSFINPSVSDEKLIKGGRIVTVLAGVIGIGLAIVLPKRNIGAVHFLFTDVRVDNGAAFVRIVYEKKLGCFCYCRSRNRCYCYGGAGTV